MSPQRRSSRSSPEAQRRGSRVARLFRRNRNSPPQQNARSFGGIFSRNQQQPQQRSPTRRPRAPTPSSAPSRSRRNALRELAGRARNVFRDAPQPSPLAQAEPAEGFARAPPPPPGQNASYSYALRNNRFILIGPGERYPSPDPSSEGSRRAASFVDSTGTHSPDEDAGLEPYNNGIGTGREAWWANSRSQPRRASEGNDTNLSGSTRVAGESSRSGNSSSGRASARSALPAPRPVRPSQAAGNLENLEDIEEFEDVDVPEGGSVHELSPATRHNQAYRAARERLANRRRTMARPIRHQLNQGRAHPVYLSGDQVAQLYERHRAAVDDWNHLTNQMNHRRRQINMRLAHVDRAYINAERAFEANSRQQYGEQETNWLTRARDLDAEVDIMSHDERVFLNRLEDAGAELAFVRVNLGIMEPPNMGHASAI